MAETQVSDYNSLINLQEECVSYGSRVSFFETQSYNRYKYKNSSSRRTLIWGHAEQLATVLPGPYQNHKVRPMALLYKCWKRYAEKPADHSPTAGAIGDD